jgi:hypothetical protein
MIKENTLLAFEENIRNRSFMDWVKAHTSGFKPLHRYEGILEIRKDRLIFYGKDVKDGEEFKLEISFKDIIDVYYGFDEIFKGREERAWPWDKPLRIRFRMNEIEKTIYLFANFHHKYGIRTSDNEEVYKKLNYLLGHKASY